MLDTIFAEVTLVATRVRLAIKELLVKRLERIATLCQASQGTDTQVRMPAIHSHALESLKSSISRDKALIAQSKGESAPPPKSPESIKQAPESVRQGTERIKKRGNERDQRRSRRKSYLK